MKIISNILGWVAIVNASFTMAAMKGALPEIFLNCGLGYGAIHFIYCGVMEEGIFNSSGY